MDPANARRARLSHLIETRYDGRQVDFLKESGESQSEISGILNGRKSFGEKKARKIEASIGLPSGWLDEGALVPTGAPTSSEASSVDIYLARLRTILSGRSEEELEKIVRAIELLVPTREAEPRPRQERRSYTDAQRVPAQTQPSSRRRKLS